MTPNKPIVRNGIAKFNNVIRVGGECIELFHKVSYEFSSHDPIVAVEIDDKPLCHLARGTEALEA